MQMRRVSVLWAVLLLCAGLSLGQTAEVIHNVNLRHDPSTSNSSIRLMPVGEVLTLLEPGKTAGYFHVRTSQAEEGWVWGNNVHVSTAPPPPATGGGAASGSVDPSWDKPAPVEITFHAASGTCGPDGDPTGDAETNHLKNRVDAPAAPHEVTFEAMIALPKLPAGSPTTRTSPNWATVAPQIAPFEGVAVSVAGFIVKVKKQTSEKTNCGFTKPAEVDWHVPLVANSNDAENLSVVVELTPRIRRAHPHWTEAALAPTGPKPKFRISGWLMFDPDHPGHLFDPANPQPHRFRQTLWEIHPVTRIEVMKGGAWVNLDGLP